MKNYMAYFFGLYGRCGGKNLIRSLALLLALIVTTPVLLAEDGNHGDRNHEPGKGNDLAGVWTQTFDGGGLWLVTIHEDGTVLVDQQGNALDTPVQSTQQGLWKRVGARVFISSCFQIEYNRDENKTLFATVIVQGLYTLYPSGDQFDCRIIATETLTNGTVNTYGPFPSHGVRFRLTPPAF